MNIFLFSFFEKAKRNSKLHGKNCIKINKANLVRRFNKPLKLSKLLENCLNVLSDVLKSKYGGKRLPLINSLFLFALFGL